MKVKTAHIYLYSHYASALINGDLSGLEDSDIVELDHILNLIKSDYGTADCIDADTENTDFQYPEYSLENLRGDVCLFTFALYNK